MIYPKKKVIKGASGMDTGKVLGMASKAASAIPGPWGIAASAALGIGSDIANQFKEKKIEKEAANRENIAQANQLDVASNETYGKLTYEHGGEFMDEVVNNGAVQDNAVVLGGKSHDEGGNEVVDADSGEKVAETESQELLFTKSQTDAIEGHIAKYDQLKDAECFLEIGTMIQDIVKNNMIDYSGKYK